MLTKYLSNVQQDMTADYKHGLQKATLIIDWYCIWKRNALKIQCILSKIRKDTETPVGVIHLCNVCSRNDIFMNKWISYLLFSTACGRARMLADTMMQCDWPWWGHWSLVWRQWYTRWLLWSAPDSSPAGSQPRWNPDTSSQRPTNHNTFFLFSFLVKLFSLCMLLYCCYHSWWIKLINNNTNVCICGRPTTPSVSLCNCTMRIQNVWLLSVRVNKTIQLSVESSIWG